MFKVKTLYQCKGIHDSIKTEVLKFYPHLFEKPDPEPEIEE